MEAFERFKLVLLLFSAGFSNGISSAAELYKKFNEANITLAEINQWLDQFDQEDREAAIMLLQQIDYYSYRQLIKDLSFLHRQVLACLKKEGFIEDDTKEILFNKIDFSKTYPAKSGDLISYFYRTANKIRGVAFKNLDDLYRDGEDKSNRCLIILDDYASTGTQFLFEQYANAHYDLFNHYRKVFHVVLVANKSAIEKFEKVKRGDHESLAQDFFQILNVNEEAEKKKIYENVKKIHSDKLEIIFLHQEVPLFEKTKDCDAKSSEKIADLLQKYCMKQYLGGNYDTNGHTVFFYNCPNNLPEILWNSKSKKRDGSPWTPLFKRIEDLSIYDMAKGIPAEEQIW
ncbi:hypothetical protein [Parachlamydia sp. AcF125]|uniref:phosphoribosyltransferase-like protein n=1 Tax=Parachlamydia sp. AcF125 TaxID=2795736 RepID=UPI001BC9C74B|nr:hypothetical protein [Parachlamydia sp. AcF125]MBS4168939.1 hypothetical protein [Parachlamydia sp. AcF125]